MSDVSQPSRQVQLVLRRADQAVDKLATKYEEVLAKQLAEFGRHMDVREWDKAGNIIHMVAGEAGSFNRPYTGEIAEMIRLLLDAENPRQHLMILNMLVDGLNVYIKAGTERHTKETEDLIDGLRAVVSMTVPSSLPPLPNPQE
jgi:hypothetical protein